MKHVNFKKWKEPVNAFLKIIKDSSPTVFTVCGCVGLVTTVCLTVRATVKSTQIVNAHKEEIDKIPQKTYKVAEVINLTWREYIPVMLIGGTSIGCIVASNSINLKRNAAMMATYVTAEEKIKHYEDHIREKSLDSVSKEETNKVIVVDGNKCLCKDLFSGRIFKTSVSNIQTAESRLNQMLPCNFTVTVNDLYDELDLDRVDMGDDYGWRLEEGDSVNITIDAIMDDSNGPIMQISYEPKRLRCDF